MFLAVLLTATLALADDEMKGLDFLIGEWSGEATMQMGPGKSSTVLQTEKVTSKAGGKALLVEGLGKRKLADGKAGDVVHDAIALISWDKTKKTYHFDAHVAQQESVDTTIDLVASNTAVWGFDSPRGKVRYTIRLNDKGQWNEVGEFSADGQKWMPFFEMTLTKIK